MKSRYVILPTLVIMAIVAIGCQKLMNLYPADITKAQKVYVGKDPNVWSYDCLGSLKEINDESTLKHNLTQSELNYLADRDNLTYTTVIRQGLSAQETAQKEAEAAMGLGSAAIGAILGGGGMAAVLRRIWFTEKEVKKIVAKNGGGNTVLTPETDKDVTIV